MNSPATLPRLLAGAGAPEAPGGPHLAVHLAHHPLPALDVDAAALIAAVEAAGLHGRGGAGFPTATKLHAVAGGRRRAVVVANGVEGEPASAKDRTLLELVPHLVLDGVQLAARAVGAGEAIVCVREEHADAQLALAGALAERALAGRDPLPVRVVPMHGGYVAGEETALVHQLNGGAPLPTLTPPRPFERGVGGRPTLVQNVETLAHVALIAAHGAAWFRTLGTREEPGSALVTVGGAVELPGVREVALGTSLEEVVAAAGGDLARAQAVLIGGYFGTWLAAASACELTLDAASLRSRGASLGCGVIAVLPADGCGVAETTRLVRWLAGQSAGQCGPCVHGLAAIASQLEAIETGRIARQPPARGARRTGAVEDPIARLRRWSGDVGGRGACRHPDGVVRLLASALRTFAEDFDDHLRHGPCSASA